PARATRPCGPGAGRGRRAWAAPTSPPRRRRRGRRSARRRARRPARAGPARRRVRRAGAARRGGAAAGPRGWACGRARCAGCCWAGGRGRSAACSRVLRRGGAGRRPRYPRGTRLGRCRAYDGPGRGRMARAPAPPPLPRGAAHPPRGRPSPMTAVRPARTAAAPSSAAASPDATSPVVASPDPATPDAYAGLRDAVGRWFAETARDLPWRAADRTAWGVLVSEVMLQQTPVVRVEPVWRAWMDRWPEPADLAAAPTADVLRAWGRLGYPRRALRLQECARAVVERHGGVVPGTEEELRALPGIGEYTAAAVVAFAFGRRSVVVDTNVRRVLARTLAGD